MQNCEHTVESFTELHAYIHATLCGMENLLEEQFTTHQRQLISHEEVAGIEYTLHGLRSVRLGAIWAADSNQIYFYNARGERDKKVRLAKRLPAINPSY